MGLPVPSPAFPSIAAACLWRAQREETGGTPAAGVFPQQGPDLSQDL